MRTRRELGSSLVELMVALTLGLVAVAAVGSVFLLAAANHREGDRRARTQDSLRFAMTQLTQDLEMAGFFAQLREPAQLAVHGSVATYAAAGCDREWVFGTIGTIESVGNATVATARAAFPCIGGGELEPGTDLISVKRLRGRCSDPRSDADGDGLEDGDGRYYVRTDGAQAVLYRHADGVPPPPPAGTVCPTLPATGGVEVYEYMPAIWYVRRYPVIGSAPVPSLCRKALRGARLEAECLVEGVEDLQLELGIDDDGNGVADAFRSFDGVVPEAAAARIVAVRVHVLARAPQADPGHRSARAFRLGDRLHAAAQDGYHRRALSSVVLVRNAARRTRPFGLPG